MRKSQFSQFYSMLYVLLLVSFFSIFYVTVQNWSTMRMVSQEFSNLKTIIYESGNYGINQTMVFNERVNVSFRNGDVFLNASGISFNGTISNIILPDAELLIIQNLTVYADEGGLRVE